MESIKFAYWLHVGRVERKGKCKCNSYTFGLSNEDLVTPFVEEVNIGGSLGLWESTNYFEHMEYEKASVRYSNGKK